MTQEQERAIELQISISRDIDSYNSRLFFRTNDTEKEGVKKIRELMAEFINLFSLEEGGNFYSIMYPNLSETDLIDLKEFVARKAKDCLMANIETQVRPYNVAVAKKMRNIVEQEFLTGVRPDKILEKYIKTEDYVDICGCGCGAMHIAKTHEIKKEMLSNKEQIELEIASLRRVCVDSEDIHKIELLEKELADLDKPKQMNMPSGKINSNSKVWDFMEKIFTPNKD